LAIFALTSYSDVLALLNYRGRSQVCSFIIQRIIETNSLITSEEEVEKVCFLECLPILFELQLFNLLATLVVDQTDQNSAIEDTENFEEEQNLVARLVHLIYNESADQHFVLLNKVRKIFGKGGSLRLRYTLAPVVFATYKLLNRYHSIRDEVNFGLFSNNL
jgi:vacuolar protein sorting-associated protein 35